MSALRHAVVLGSSLFLALGAAAPAAAQVEPGATAGGSVVKTGWWWQANENPAAGEVPAAPPQPSAPPNVPEGSLPVSAVGGEPEKITAIEIALKAEPGAAVTSLLMSLRESKEPGANLNQDRAKVAACPITDLFWTGGEAAPWRTRPTYDCKLGKAAGERDKQGVWQFDLTAIAAGQVSMTGGTSVSVVLVEQVDAPESFQVVYDGPEADGIGIRASTTAPPNTGADPAPGQGSALASAGPEPGTPVGVGAQVPAGGSASSLPISGGSGAAPAPVELPKVDPVAAAPAGDTAAPATAAAPATTVSATPTALPPWYAGIPRAGWLLVPLMLGLAYLAMLALGPDAQPAATTSQRGVGRALERLRQAGGSMSSALARTGR